MSGNALWPDLPLAAWSETCETLYRWTQVAGKVRLALTPLVNHWWNVTFRVSARGLVAPANPYAGGTFDIVFDFVDHQLRIATSDGRTEGFALVPMSVADFYAAFMQCCAASVSTCTSGPCPAKSKMPCRSIRTARTRNTIPTTPAASPRRSSSPPA